MKPLKQAMIPKNTVEIIMRGSKFDQGNLSARFIVPASIAGEILVYGLPKSVEKKIKPSKKL